MVLPDSDGLSRVPSYSGTGTSALLVVYGAITLYGPPFLDGSTKNRFLKTGPTTLQGQVLAVWADPLSLAATDGVEFFFLFLGVMRCFSSPRSLHAPMDSVHGNSGIPGSTRV